MARRGGVIHAGAQLDGRVDAGQEVVQMPWWAWLATGVVLLIVEVAIQTEFWLAVLGGAALLVGAIGWVLPNLPLWLQWIELSVFSILLAVFVRRSVHDKFVGSAPGIAPDLVGDVVTANASIDPGAVGAVQHRGSVWQARNVGGIAIVAGSTARIRGVDGVVLQISN
jgi:membrane protein implicated in regulation of membrane protease activity